MTLELPTPVARYFEADGSTGAAVAQCFTPDAVVIDEGRTYCGRGAIREWKDRASAKYAYTCEPRSAGPRGAGFAVTCEVGGTFPGSPVRLRYHFDLDDGRIAALEINP